MDLKIKDVTDLLNVSETTLRRWISDGKIPVYRINQQYRFNRQEIEDWLMSQRQDKGGCETPHNTAEAVIQTQKGSRQFCLYRAINKGKVLHDVPAKDKEALIRATTKQIATDLNLDDEVISHMLLEREKLHSTAVGHGIAIPHTRDFLLSSFFDVVTVVFLKHPIAFDAIDGQPVHTLFFLFASDDKNHLHLLAKIAHLSSDPKAREFFKSQPSRDKLLDYVKSWESQHNIH